MENSERLAYFLDEEAIRTIFPDWPEAIEVALCLDEAGGCETLVHHRDEGRAVLGRVGELFGRPPGGFQVTPPVEGYPTRRVLFSEEQKLLALMAEAEDLPQIAADYAVAYQRRLEAGPPPERREAPRGKLTLRDVLRKQRPAEPALPPGYTLATSGAAAECQFLSAEISVQDRQVRLVIAPAEAGARTRVVRVAEVGFREDFARFVLPRAALQGWHRGEAVVLEMAREMFPSELANLLAAFPREAEVTVTRHGIFVMPGGPVEASAEPAPVRPPKIPQKPPRAPLVTPLRAATVVLAVAGLLTGTVVHALRQEAAPPAAMAVPEETAAETAALSGPETEAGPLELLTALAREEARGPGE